jgi:hypothetical protein
VAWLDSKGHREEGRKEGSWDSEKLPLALQEEERIA